jgi:hypothetical protein
MKHRLSLYAFTAGALLILWGGLFFYPKWKMPHTEATIGWDVSGYYAYLPAAFIYHDLEKAVFLDTIIAQYQPTPGRMQGFWHWSGAYIMKYSMGQALQFLPWFAIAHAMAEPLGYPADGYSRPYQAAISWGSLLVALLGLWFARRNLLFFFSDKATAIALLLLVLGTNYLNYMAIDHAMTHNWLFTCYSLLIYATIRFYQKPAFGWAAAIGILLGWAALTRPSELAAALLPLLWGVSGATALRKRIALALQHWSKYLLAGALMAGMGFLQLAYWKYYGKEWTIYSYEDQGFDWGSPHVTDVLFSFRAGWLVYSPLMIFAVAGLFFLKKHQSSIFPAVLVFSLLNLYVVCAWSIWWYGGGLGMRALVQSYAVWLFPLAAFIQWLSEKKWGLLAFAPVLAGGIWLNLWWTKEAHVGRGAFVSEQMTKAFFLQVVGRNHFERDWLKLLDTKEMYRGKERRNVKVMYKNDFETDTVGVSRERPIAGAQSLLLSKERQFSPEYALPVTPSDKGWIRASVIFACEPKEWDWWRMTQFIVKFYNKDQVVKERMIRLQRHVDGNETKTVFFDTRVPLQPFDRAVLLFWNADSDKQVRVDEVVVELGAE